MHIRVQFLLQTHNTNLFYKTSKLMKYGVESAGLLNNVYIRGNLSKASLESNIKNSSITFSFLWFSKTLLFCDPTFVMTTVWLFFLSVSLFLNWNKSNYVRIKTINLISVTIELLYFRCTKWTCAHTVTS